MATITENKLPKTVGFRTAFVAIVELLNEHEPFADKADTANAISEALDRLGIIEPETAGDWLGDLYEIINTDLHFKIAEEAR